MRISRSMDPGWLSNAYLVYDEPGSNAVFVDSGAPLEPLLEEAERERLTVTHLLLTHGDTDHVAGNAELERRFGIEPTQDAVETGALRIEVLPTPGHTPDCVSFVIDGACFSGDTLFKDAVGGTRTDFQGVRSSVMDVLMKLPRETKVYPGHTDETTIGREWEHNPFVRVWRGLDPEGTERVRFAGRDATLIVWSPDYDGKGKAWLRFDDGQDVIVGGSRIERN